MLRYICNPASLRLWISLPTFCYKFAFNKLTFSKHGIQGYAIEEVSDLNPKKKKKKQMNKPGHNLWVLVQKPFFLSMHIAFAMIN